MIAIGRVVVGAAVALASAMVVGCADSVGPASDSPVSLARAVRHLVPGMLASTTPSEIAVNTTLESLSLSAKGAFYVTGKNPTCTPGGSQAVSVGPNGPANPVTAPDTLIYSLGCAAGGEQSLNGQVDSLEDGGVIEVLVNDQGTLTGITTVIGDLKRDAVITRMPAGASLELIGGPFSNSWEFVGWSSTLSSPIFSTANPLIIPATQLQPSYVAHFVGVTKGGSGGGGGGGSGGCGTKIIC